MWFATTVEGRRWELIGGSIGRPRTRALISCGDSSPSPDVSGLSYRQKSLRGRKRLDSRKLATFRPYFTVAAFSILKPRCQKPVPAIDLAALTINQTVVLIDWTVVGIDLGVVRINSTVLRIDSTVGQINRAVGRIGSNEGGIDWHEPGTNRTVPGID